MLGFWKKKKKKRKEKKRKENADISKIKKVLVLKYIFFETTYVFLLTYQISSFKQNSNEF